jgi:MFS family permease
MDSTYQTPSEIGRWRTLALGIGGISAIIVLVAALIFPEYREQALRSWLLGFVFWGGIGIGSLGLLILQYLTGGAWGVVIRRILEAGSRTIFPGVFILFLPLLLGVKSLYDWSHPHPGDKILEHRGAYLSWEWWGFRALVYFALLSIMAYLLNNWSKEQDEATSEQASANILEKASRFCGPTMVFFVLTVSFAAIDWVMTLDPHWYSTIFGLLFVIGWALSCLAFVIAILAWLSDREPMRHIVGKRHFHDLGKLMLAFVMVWAYFNFSQYLIIWSGNLPEETEWYITRQTGVWAVIGAILLFFHFAFPFLVLLSRDVKRNAKWISLVAIFILIMRLVDMYYIIGPAPMVGMGGKEMPFHLNWMDFAAPIAVGGIWLWWFFGELMKRPLIPINDPYLENAIAHGKGH